MLKLDCIVVKEKRNEISKSETEWRNQSWY